MSMSEEMREEIETGWKEYCNALGCWYEDMLSVKAAYIGGCIKIDNTRHHHHETVQHWEDRTGETYPDDGPVWSAYRELTKQPIETYWKIETWSDAREWEWDTPSPSIVANHHGKPGNP